MNIDVVILVVAVLTNIVLAVLVLRRNSSSATHLLFAALGIALSTWSVVNYFAVHSHSNPAATWLVRLVMFSSAPIGVLFFLLMHTYPRTSLALSRRNFLLVMTLMVLTMAVTLSPWLFPEVTPISDGAPQPTPGPGLIIYVPVVIFGIIYGLYILIRKFFKARGIQRVQMGYLLVGVAAMFIMIIGLNFLSVVLFNISSFNQFGPLFTIPFTSLTAYTMIRYRLLDIRAAIFRSLSFSFLVGAVLLTYGLLLIFAVPFISEFTGLRGEIIAAVAALISIPVARFIQGILTRLTDRFLFQNRADYKKALVQVGQDLSGTIAIGEVTNIVLKVMREIVRSRKTIILLQETPRGRFVPRAADNAGQFDVPVPYNHVLLQHLRHTSGPMAKDELSLLKERGGKIHHGEIDGIEQALNWLDVSVVVPLFVNKELTGIILLGDKLSGDPYLKDDMEFLAALAPQAATALENARLYKESLEFGQKLKIEVTRATKELATANDQLKDIDKAKSEFLSIASHQLYTPLTALRGYISMMMEGGFGKLSDQQQPVLGILEKSATRLIELIKNLLDISRIESGRLELNLESVDLATLAKELVQDLMPNAMNKKLKLNWHDATTPGQHVVADAQRIRQVMLNFIDNSIKYTPSGQIDVRVEQQGEEVVFSVTDTGKGITAEEINRLFTKFTRVGGSSRFHTEGTGLGLYVAKQIVNEHRGDVSVTSPGSGQGSVFSMRLPAEGSARSLKLGDKATVVIKAAEATSA